MQSDCVVQTFDLKDAIAFDLHVDLNLHLSGGDMIGVKGIIMHQFRNVFSSSSKIQVNT